LISTASRSRVTRVPLPGGKLRRTCRRKPDISFISSARRFITDAPPTVSVGENFSFKDRKETVLAEGAGNYSLSSDGSKIIVGQGTAFTDNGRDAAGRKLEKAGFDRRADDGNQSG
jgi:hypothetical protein